MTQNDKIKFIKTPESYVAINKINNITWIYDYSFGDYSDGGDNYPFRFTVYYSDGDDSGSGTWKYKTFEEAKLAHDKLLSLFDIIEI